MDVNENIHAPVFGRDFVETSVPESASPHTLVTSVPAVDGDLGVLDSAVTYSLFGNEGRGLFYIDQHGEKLLASGIYYEKTYF